MAKDFKVDGRMKVSTLKSGFVETYGVAIRVYKGKKFAPEDSTLSSIRDEGAKGGGIAIHGKTKVGNVEKMFKEEMGITIQIEDSSGGLANNDVSLSSLK